MVGLELLLPSEGFLARSRLADLKHCYSNLINKHSMKWLNRVALRTPESVELEFILAGLGHRALAYGIDLALGSLLIAGFSLLWGIINAPLINLLSAWLGNVEQVELWLFALQIIAIFLIQAGYFMAFEVLWQGQTPGKRWLHLRVVGDNGRPVGLQQAVLRSLLRPFDDLCFLGAFFIAFGRREKRLGDWVAGTLVVQEEHPNTQPLQISPAAQSLAQHVRREANLARLKPDEFAVIRTYLQRAAQLLPEARAAKSRQLATSVREIIGLTRVPEKTTASQFLEAVYLAYQEQRMGDRDR